MQSLVPAEVPRVLPVVARRLQGVPVEKPPLGLKTHCAHTCWCTHAGHVVAAGHSPWVELVLVPLGHRHVTEDQEQHTRAIQVVPALREEPRVGLPRAG